MDKQTILIVDDVSENIDVLVGILREEYNLSIAKNGKTAIELANSIRPDLMLLDVMMPEMDGYAVCAKIKEKDDTKNIPIVFLTALTQQEDEEKGLLLGAVDYITKPFEPALLKARVKTHLELKAHRDNLQKMVDEQTEEIKKTRDVALASMAFLAEFRDPETGAHVLRTKEYVKALAQHLKPEFPDQLTDARIEAMFQAAELHDIGKVGVPDSILLKPSKLNENEWKEMRNHTIYGAEVLRKTERMLGTTTLFLSMAKEIAESHHEKWDGSGYPHALSGEEIPLSARLMAIADIYDALMSKRSYKEAYTHERAVEIITQGDGRTKPEHFDPVVLRAFGEINDRFRDIIKEIPDEE